MKAAASAVDLAARAGRGGPARGLLVTVGAARPGTGAGRALPPGSRLRVHRAPERPSAAVLLLHGGRADSLQPVPRLALARLRMHPFAAQIARRPWGRQALVAAVRYRYRGWNGDQAHPVQDALQALDELSALAPGVPVLLVGHSMGARAALAVAGADAVRGVVALAPWCPPGEPVAHLRGRAAVFLHDESDRITSAAQTWDFAHRAAAAGADVRCVPMPNGGHAMIRGARRWHELAADHAGAVLARTPAPHPGGAAPSGRS